MIVDLALVVDTTSKYSDVWPMFFGQLQKYFPQEIKKYLFTDTSLDLKINNLVKIYYNNDDSYRTQLLTCLEQVQEKYILYNSEDYILYDNVDMETIKYLKEVLEINNDFDFVKFIKGPERVHQIENDPNLYVIDSSDSNFFAQQASLWKTESLLKIFRSSPPDNGRMEQEPGGSAIARRLGIGGLQYHTGKEIKRGIHHWDSIIYPCIATAVVKGRWNVKEYKDLLSSMFLEYEIDPELRGMS